MYENPRDGIRTTRMDLNKKNIESNSNLTNLKTRPMTSYTNCKTSKEGNVVSNHRSLNSFNKKDGANLLKDTSEIWEYTNSKVGANSNKPKYDGALKTHGSQQVLIQGNNIHQDQFNRHAEALEKARIMLQSGGTTRIQSGALYKASNLNNIESLRSNSIQPDPQIPVPLFTNKLYSEQNQPVDELSKYRTVPTKRKIVVA